MISFKTSINQNRQKTTTEGLKQNSKTFCFLSGWLLKVYELIGGDVSR
jgi:hypothetical protein